MAKEFIPRLGILPPPQRQLWPLLKDTPGYFTLYGGTAIALRLGHRQSVDFDFFSNQPFDPGVLLRTIPYLKQATVLQLEQNSLTCRVNFQGTVQLSYFGDLSLKKVAQPEIAEGPQIKVAALIDLAATKADVCLLYTSREITGKSSHKVFIYQKYLDLLSQGTKPL